MSGYSVLCRVFSTDHIQVEGRYTGQKLYIDGEVIAETTNGNLLLRVSLQDHVSGSTYVDVYASDGYWDNLMVVREYAHLGDFFYRETPTKVVVRHWEPQTKWHQSEARVAEYGIDRGVLYLSNDVVVPWNGLVRVSENIDGVDIEPYYVDGVKRLDVPSTFEIEGEIEAYSAPKQFAAYVGEAEIAPGFYGSNQMPRPFCLSYRTRVTTANGKQHYKIHILYNVLAQPSDREYNTVGEDTEPSVFTWEFKTTPQVTNGIRSSLFTIDSRELNPIALAIIESRLYGYDQDEPDMLTPDEIAAVIADHPL